ncbi:MAG: hypothetical protein ACE37H_03720 [Phycisphaeraceae bacterium]
MQRESGINRRVFLGSVAAAGGVSLLGRATLNVRGDADRAVEGETPHFRYRLAPASPYVVTQRGSEAFAFTDRDVLLSGDCGETWPHRAAFPDAPRITFGCILSNGTVLFATRTRLFRSADKLKTIETVTVQHPDGTPYRPHQPLDPGLPGWYFHPLHGACCWDVDGREMVVWGNYCNVIGGASPVNLYYSADGGRSVKLAYAFGQSPRWQQKGAGPGDLLGDPANPVITRHVHCVAYNPAERAFYACTGDHDEKDHGVTKHECHWLRGTYDRDADRWAWRVVVSDTMNSRYKSGGINFVDGKLYWCSDANGPKPHDRGIFACDPQDLADKSRHTMLFNPTYEIANMLIEDGVILSGHYTPASPYHVGIIYSPDMGKTWAQYDLKGLGRWSPVRLEKKNADGWFRMDLREGWIKRGRVMYLQPK